MRSGKAGERGYNLVALVMLIAVLNVAIAIALPLWSHQIRRDKEEELISRGFQYAEAIRVFQRRFGRLPNRLEELIEVEPRSIRQLWREPMNPSGRWALILQGAGNRLQRPPTPEGEEPVEIVEPPTPVGPLFPGEEEPELGSSETLAPPGPIRGVRSLSTDAAIHRLFEREAYADWEFRVDLVSRAPNVPGTQGAPRMNAMTLGRPYRYPPPFGNFGAPPTVGPIPGGAPPPGGSRPPQPSNAPPSGRGPRGGVGQEPPRQPSGERPSRRREPPAPSEPTARRKPPGGPV